MQREQLTYRNRAVPYILLKYAICNEKIILKKYTKKSKIFVKNFRTKKKIYSKKLLQDCKKNSKIIYNAYNGREPDYEGG